MKVLVLLCMVALTWAQDKAGIDLEKDKFVDDLWDRVAKDDQDTVGEQELDDFFKQYDSKDSSPPESNLYEFDWVGGSKTIPEDFGVSVNHSVVFFKLLDVDDYFSEIPDIYERLTRRDFLYIVELGDDEFDGRLNETQFRFAFDRLVRGASFGKMYVDFRPTLGNSLYDDYLGVDNWMNVYDDLDEDGNGELNTDEFVSSWVARNYGGEAQGREVFYWLQIETSGYLYREEWFILYLLLDVDGDGLLAIEEVLLLDFWINEDVPETRQSYISNMKRLSKK